MERESFVFYKSFFEAIKELKEKDRLKVYDAICEYALNGNESELKGIPKAIVEMAKPVIDSSNNKYKACIENGKKGGAPKGNQNAKKTTQENNQKQPKNNLTGCLEKQPSKTTQNNLNVNDNDNVNVNDNVNSAVVDINIKKIIKCYEENIGMFTPATAELLLSYLDDFSVEIIEKAIKIASQHNKKNAKYIQGILNDWTRKGLKTLSDIENEQSHREKRKSDDVLYENLEDLYDNL